MRTSDRTFRNITCIVFALMISATLAACGGGGGSSTSPGTSGPASVRVSIASAPDYPAGTTFASSTSSPATAAPPGNSPDFEHVWVTVTKIALIPSTGTELPDGNGETERQNSSAEEGRSGMPGFKTSTLSTPIRIDLLNHTLDNAALLLNTISGVPAGEYSKIRLYYDNVVGENVGDNVTFHPTAHYHFDVHFVGGNLIIPLVPDPDHGIRILSVVINVVGLKYHKAGQSGNVLLRPQVFATVDNSSLKYLVSGVAQNVNPGNHTFDILTRGGTTVSARHDTATVWIYIDNTVDPANRSSAVGLFLGASGLENGAIVDVFGSFPSFPSDNALLATEVDITFPDLLTGKVYLGWIGDILELRPPVPAGDNTVFPRPTRTSAYYDNAVDSTRLYDTNISDNATIIARGYNVTGGINAYWISIGP